MNKSEFQQKISESNKPVLVDFWADWREPCKVTKPILEKLSKEFAEKVEFMPVNADDSSELLEQFHIKSIPTVIILRGGKEVGYITSAQNEESYRAMFEALSEGRKVKIPVSEYDRRLRLGVGALVIMVGVSSSNWILAGIGGVIAFLGIYDRLPNWKIIKGMFKRS
jgi:thioredoxin 1